MPSLAEIWRTVHGAWRLLLLDIRGLGDFDGSRSGGLRSFWSIAAVLPLTFAIVAIEESGTSSEPAAPHSTFVDLGGLVLAWLLLIAIIYGLVSWHGRAERFWLFVSTYNWTQIPLAVVILLTAAMVAGASRLVDFNADAASVPTLEWSVAHVAVGVAVTLRLGALGYEWYVAWVSLDSGIALPIIVVLLDIVMGVGLNHLSATLA